MDKKLDRVYTIPEIAEITGFTRGYIWWIIKTSQIPAETHGKVILVREKEFKKHFTNMGKEKK